MEPIYHLVSRATWGERPGEDYRADSLTTEGFIHCSFAAQLMRSANRFHASTIDLIALEIDPARLAAELRVEPPSPTSATSELFPHVYGPINRAAVAHEHDMKRGEDGRWIWSH